MRQSVQLWFAACSCVFGLEEVSMEPRAEHDKGSGKWGRGPPNGGLGSSERLCRGKGLRTTAGGWRQRRPVGILLAATEELLKTGIFNI